MYFTGQIKMRKPWTVHIGISRDREESVMDWKRQAGIDKVMENTDQG